MDQSKTELARVIKFFAVIHSRVQREIINKKIDFSAMARSNEKPLSYQVEVLSFDQESLQQCN